MDPRIQPPRVVADSYRTNTGKVTATYTAEADISARVGFQCANRPIGVWRPCGSGIAPACTDGFESFLQICTLSHEVSSIAAYDLYRHFVRTSVCFPFDSESCSRSDTKVGAPAELAIEFDRRPPKVIFERRDSRPTVARPAFTRAHLVFRFRSTTESTFECMLDDKNIGGCASPLTIGRPLKNGRHVISVRATNSLGTVGAWHAKHFSVHFFKAQRCRGKRGAKKRRCKRANARDRAEWRAKYRDSVR